MTNHFGRSLNFAYNSTSSVSSLSTVTLPDNSKVGYSYDSTGRLASVALPGGVSKSYLYTSTTTIQALTGIVDENGNASTYDYDGYGRATSSALPGNIDRYQVSYVTGSVSVVTDPLGTTRTYTYTAQNGKLAVVGADKPSGTGEPDAASRIQDTNGLITEETDFLGVKTMYTWDTTRRLPTKVIRADTLPEAQTTETTWHPTFRLPTFIKQGNLETAYEYYETDNLRIGNLKTQTITDKTTGVARTWAWTYNNQGLNDKITDPKGGIWAFGYDPQGNRTSVTNPKNQSTAYEYDTAGRVKKETAPNGLVTNYGYDPRGRLLTASIVTGTATSEVTTYSYTPTGQLATALLPNGYQLNYHYDIAQRLDAVGDNRSNTVTYTLDAMGNRTAEVLKDGANVVALASSRVINELNRVQTVSGSTSAQSTALTYDANGEFASQTDPLLNKTSQTLDKLRRPTEVTFADNSKAQQAWNALNQLTSVTDPKTVKTTYERNAFGEVTREVNLDAGNANFQYDALGDLTRRQDLKNVTVITRDALGRPTKIRYNNSTTNIVNFTWDTSPGTGLPAQVGYLTEIQDPSGSTLYERDQLGRILTKTQTINDNASNPTILVTRYSYLKGDLASITYPSGLKITYNRSNTGQITGISTQTSPSAATNAFASNLSYTALGQPKAWNWANGDSASRVFDADARMKENEFAVYGFDAASRITAITQNLWASRTTTAVIGTGTTVVNELYKLPQSWDVAYDKRDRITSFNRNNGQSSYNYDANSNRLGFVSTDIIDIDRNGSYTSADKAQKVDQSLTIAPSSNRLLGFAQTSSTQQGSNTTAVTSSSVSFVLDSVGNITTDGIRTFEYDEANRHSQTRITEVAGDGEASKITYLHNGLGQRVFKSEPQIAQTAPNEATLGTDFVTWLKTNFSWLFAAAQADATLGQSYVYADGQLPSHALLGEYGNGGANSLGRYEYIWLPTDSGDAIPIGLYKSGKFFAVHSDHLGTPRLITDETNTPVWQWPYSAFGESSPTGVLAYTSNSNLIYTQDPTSLNRLKLTTPGVVYNLRHAGQYADAETGLFYNYFRTYDPKTGRYSQSDPIGLDGGWNRFGYVSGDPLSFFDANGLQQTRAGRPLENQLLEGGGGIGGPTTGGPSPFGGGGLGRGGGLSRSGGSGGGAGKLPDSALVCRGGMCTAERFENGSGVRIDSSGNMCGASVNSAGGRSLNELTSTIPNGKVGVTTVGDVRRLGGDVILKPTTNNSFHCEMCGITPKQAEQLFTPVVKNPNR